ncbi:hypothetical protein [Dryocola clanedunensis]
MQLDFTLNITDDTWYPTAEIKNFKSKSGEAVNINEELIIVFSAPGRVTEGDVTVTSDPWSSFTAEIEAREVGSGIYDTKVIIKKADGKRIGNTITNVHIGVNASSDIEPKWSVMSNTFSAAADEEPGITGQLVINSKNHPAGLENVQVELSLIRGEQIVTLNPAAGTSTFDVTVGTYKVVATDLKTPDGTVSAPVILSKSELSIGKGESTELDIDFGAEVHSTTLDISIDTSSIPALNGEIFQLAYLENGVEKLTAALRAGEQLRLDNLPVSGRYAVRIADVRLNNVHYTFSEIDGSLDARCHAIIFDQSRIGQSSDSQPDAAKLTINIAAEKAVDVTFGLRLREVSSTPREYRFDNLPAQQSTHVESVTLVPGTYLVVSGSFIHDGVLYYTDASPEPLTVESNTPVQLTLTIVEGANLRVKGFPDFLSFGGCANMSPSNADDFVEARVSSLFKYSGDDGMGDAGGFLDPAKEPTSQVIAMARQVADKLNQPVLPVMVSYTCNLSLGDVSHIIKDADRLMYSFANFIQALQIAQATKDDENEVPAGFIVNPDYLGECQKNGFAPTYEIPVRGPLAEALAHHNVQIAIPADITDTLKGYIKAVNWVVRVVAPDVVLGWQVNLWSVAGSQWLYSDFTYDDVFDPADCTHKKMTMTPELAGKLTAEYALLVGVFEETPYTQADGTAAVAKGADFMATDRYEADDFTIRAYDNGYCYSPFEWDRTFDFCASLSRHLRQPVMPWQMPASRLADTNEAVTVLEDQFWGTGGSYLMGHAEIGSDINAINKKLMEIEFPSAFADMMGHNSGELFSRHEWDFTTPKYLDFPSRGIFHVQVGGGATTGVVSAVNQNSSSWMRTKLKAYRDNPVKFDTK